MFCEGAENINMKKIYIVDRIEGNFAVCECEYESMTDIELSNFSFTVNEGDVLVFEQGKYYIDKEQTKSLRQKNIDLQNSLFE